MRRYHRPTWVPLLVISKMATTFPLARLPGELQDEIWIATLPTEPHVFHVEKAVRSQANPKTAQHLIFHNRIRPPAAVYVCARARAAARVAGFIQFAQPGDNPGIWFNTRVDILYFGGSMSLFGAAFRRYPKDPPPLFTDVPGLRLVRHIGIPPGNTGGQYVQVDGRSNYVVSASYGKDPSLPLWDALDKLLRVLRKRAPAVTTLNYIMPMIHNQVWGTDEPVGELIPHLTLPITLVPARPRDMVVKSYGRRSWPIFWEAVEPLYLAALESLGPDAPKLVAWYLRRVHPIAACAEEIRRLRLE